MEGLPHVAMMERLLPIAVIGAGFSGTMTAIQLLAALPPDRPVLLCERANTFGRGLAYATANSEHLLNLRASNMSAYPDRPQHFEDWLAHADFDENECTGIRATPAGTFAARGLYGRYLSEILTDAITSGTGRPRLNLVHDAVTDLEPEPNGFALRTEGGQCHLVAGAVLAMGNLGVGERLSRHQADPWSPDSFGRLHPSLPVLVIGTGLTMVDAVAALRRHGFPGPIMAVSRRGLLPNSHAPTRTWQMPTIEPDLLASLPRLLASIRAEVVRAQATGVDWRGVLDALRPVIDRLWRRLPPAERARFLRHLRPFWDIHRHRTAPPAAEAIAAEIARGTLTVQAGRILAIEDDAAHANVTIRPRGTTQAVRLDAQCILDATGIGQVAHSDDPLIRKLIARGLIQPGPFAFGLDASADFRVVGPAPTDRLWAVGPLLRGVLWECTAVPDIRNQAADLAAIVASTVTRPSSSASDSSV